MSTHATYLLPTNIGDNHRLCFYIHYEGYPQGAAYYFWLMHQVKNNKAGFAGRFLRANDYAEFTLSHETHADTEYRYSLDSAGTLVACHQPAASEQWESLYHGAWYGFVNQYLDYEEKLYLFKTGESSKTDTVMTLAEANIYVSEKKDYAKLAYQQEAIEKAQRAEDEANAMQTQMESIIKEHNLPQQFEQDTLKDSGETETTATFISFTWSAEDVQILRPDLTYEQAIIVLKQFEKNPYLYETSWQILNHICQKLYPKQ